MVDAVDSALLVNPGQVEDYVDGLVQSVSQSRRAKLILNANLIAIVAVTVFICVVLSIPETVSLVFPA